MSSPENRQQTGRGSTPQPLEQSGSPTVSDQGTLVPAADTEGLLAKLRSAHQRVGQAVKDSLLAAKEGGEAIDELQKSHAVFVPNAARGDFWRFVYSRANISPKTAQNYQRIHREWAAVQAAVDGTFVTLADLTYTAALKKLQKPKPKPSPSPTPPSPPTPPSDVPAKPVSQEAQGQPGKPAEVQSVGAARKLSFKVAPKAAVEEAMRRHKVRAKVDTLVRMVEEVWGLKLEVQ